MLHPPLRLPTGQQPPHAQDPRRARSLRRPAPRRAIRPVSCAASSAADGRDATAADVRAFSTTDCTALCIAAGRFLRIQCFEASLALQTLQRRRNALFSWSLQDPPGRLPLSSSSATSSSSPYSSSSSSSSSFLFLLGCSAADGRRRPQRGDSRRQSILMVLNDRLHSSVCCRWKIFANSSYSSSLVCLLLFRHYDIANCVTGRTVYNY